MFVGRGDVLGQWNCNWEYAWAQLKELPLLTPKGIQILLKVICAVTDVKRGSCHRQDPVEGNPSFVLH